MLIWKNTKTLDGLIDDLPQTKESSDAEIILMGSKEVKLNDFPKLKGIFRVGVSTTNVPEKKALNQNVEVCYPSEKTKNFIYEETANFTCNLLFKSNYQNIGTIKPWEKYNRKAFSEKFLLIVGAGRVGSMVKQKMSSFLKILVYDPLKYPERNINPLIMKSDFISLHIPDSDSNIGFFGSEKLGLMKNKSTLINTSRGRIVDENALYNEVKSKRIKAVFDVFWEEPYNGKLLDCDPEYFLMSPHVASTCEEFLSGSVLDLKNFIKKLKNKHD